MSEPANTCVACRADLSETGHNPSCANKPLEKSELKRILAARPGKPQHVETVSDTGRRLWEAYQVAPEENLKTILNSPYLTAATTGLLRELASLVQLADGNRAAQTDREGRYRDVHSPMPSFTPAQAEKRIREVESRLSDEVLKLSGMTKNPSDPQEPQCIQCERKSTSVDSFCAPCAAAILKQYRQKKSPRDADTSEGTARPN